MAIVLDTLVANLLFRGDTRALDEANGKLKHLESQVNNFARRFAVAGGAITGVAGLSLRSFTRFEDELAKIVGLVGVPAEQLAEWTPELQKIAVATGVGPQELAKALFFVTSAGLRGAEAMEVLEQAAKAQAAGLGDAKTVVDLVTSAINAYGSENLTATQATDALTEAVRLGKLEPASMAASMGRLIPIASGMGVEFNEIAGLMASMSRTGTNAEDAVTQLTQIMTSLLNPSTEAEKALASVGLSAEQLRESMAQQGVLPTLEALRSTLGGNSEAMVQVFGNVRALRGVFDLLGAGLEVTTEIMGDMAENTGVLEEAFGAASQTLGFQFRRAAAGTQVALQNLGAAIAPIAKAVFDRVLPVIEKLAELLQSNSLAVRIVARSIAALGVVLIGVGGILFSFGIALKVSAFSISGLSIVTSLWRNALVSTRIQMLLSTVQLKAKTLATWLNTVAAKANTTSLFGRITALLASRAAMLASVVATGAATAATWAFNAALLANPITWIVLAIAGLIAGLVLLVKNWDAVRDAIGRAWERVRSFFSGLPGWVTVALAVIAPFIGIPILIIKHWDTLKTFFANLWDWIVDKVMWAWNQVSGIFDAIGGFFGFGGGEIEVRTSTRANPAPPAVPTLDEGGIVRRPTLAMLAVNRQPEAVVPLSLLNQLTDKLKAMLNSLDRFIADFRATQAGKNFVANLPVLMDPSKPLFPTVPPRAFAGAGAGPTYIDNRTVNVSEGAVVVNAAPGQDPVEIAQVVTQRLRDQIQAIPPAFDSGIKR